jgi:deoxyadenosine/deoxycytidine kinase
MKLIIISGNTSTGKTTLARKLAKDLDIPVFWKDEYKEREFDQLGTLPSRQQLSAIDSAANKELCKAIKNAVSADRPLIVESNFRHSQGKMIKECIQPDTEVIELFCTASGYRILKRFISRNRSGERHQGHNDKRYYLHILLRDVPGFGKLFFRPLRLSSKVLIINTTNFDRVDYDAIHKFVTDSI